MSLQVVQMDDDEVVEVDRWIHRLARGRGRLRLRIGQALAKNGDSQHLEFGFSSFGAYVKERLSVKPRWAADSRALARRLEGLPLTRAALEEDRIHWCMAEVLARDATAENEGELLALARGESVRAMAERLRAARAKPKRTAPVEGAVIEGERALTASELLAREPEAEALGIDVQDLGVIVSDSREPEDDPIHMLCVTGPVEDVWALEVARMAVEHLSGSEAPGAFVDPLLAEAYVALLPWFPGEDPISDVVRARHAALKEARLAMEERRARAELAAEPNVIAQREADAERESKVARDDDDPIPEDPWVRERRVRQWCAELASRDLWLGKHLVRFFAADGWRRLGYASEAQYAHERLGISRASMRKHMRLARETAHLERLGDAVGEIGYESALLLVRVVGPDTEEAWIERARRRTFKHLREELEATETLGRMMGLDLRDMPPPTDEEMDAWHRLERDAVTGAMYRRALEGLSAQTSSIVNDAQTSGSGGADDDQVSGSDARDVRAEGDDHAVQISGSDIDARCVRAEGDDRAVRISGSDARDVRAERGETAVQISGSDARDGRAEGDEGAVQISGSDLDARDGRAEGDEGAAQISGSDLDARDGRAEGDDEADSPAPAANRHRGTVTRHWPVRESTLLFWRQLEDAHARSGIDMSFLQLLASAFWAAWGASIAEPQDDLWQHIYDRDRRRCTSPVCTETRCLQDHHLRFRAHGGGHDDENNATDCKTCHLDGVHMGRIRVFPPASKMRWLIGRRPLLEVIGREKRELC